MKALDLHKKRHHEVERLVEDFLIFNEPPVKIITGNSDKMKELVIDVVKRFGFFCHYENLTNYGSLVVTREDL
tara:strand:+ start:1202 stop:1420 length:219 start_codon:yes stop_codon:yes gene_type:complete